MKVYIEGSKVLNDWSTCNDSTYCGIEKQAWTATGEDLKKKRGCKNCRRIKKHIAAHYKPAHPGEGGL